jgi:hypothetical protein
MLHDLPESSPKVTRVTILSTYRHYRARVKPDEQRLKSGIGRRARHFGHSHEDILAESPRFMWGFHQRRVLAIRHSSDGFVTLHFAVYSQ